MTRPVLVAGIFASAGCGAIDGEPPAIQGRSGRVGCVGNGAHTSGGTAAGNILNFFSELK